MGCSVAGGWLGSATLQPPQGSRSEQEQGIPEVIPRGPPQDGRRQRVSSEANPMGMRAA